jgi:D-alanyl-D-alanine-carboxypeptidase/D-alanyl-D-alanine-endopeptidase
MGTTRRRARVASAAAAVVLAAGALGCGESPHESSPRPPISATPQTDRSRQAGPPVQAMYRSFDAVYRRYARDIVGACFGGIVGGTEAARCYGRVSRYTNRRPTPATLFQVGSIAKTITATLLALRVNEGRVRFSDPLRDYIPTADGSADIPESLSLFDAATHHSGLPRTPPADISSLDQYLGLVGRCEATPGCALGPPGAGYAYSNFAYGVLGEALARHDGYAESSYSAWEKDIRANITGPLGMSRTRSWFGWRASDPRAFDARRARATVGDPPREAVPPFYPPAPYADAAAGLYSTAGDMLRWLSYSMGASGTTRLAAARPLLYESPRLIRAREAGNPRHAVGLAWDIDSYGEARASTTCISKDGAARGFSANMVFVRGGRRGAFVILNSRPEHVTTPEISSSLVNSLPAAPGHTAGACGVFVP